MNFHLHDRILPESVMWLSVHGRVAEAEDILHKMARWNGVALPDDRKLILTVDSSAPAEKPLMLQVQKHVFWAVSHWMRGAFTTCTARNTTLGDFHLRKRIWFDHKSCTPTVSISGEGEA